MSIQIAVQTVDLCKPLKALTDMADYHRVRLFVLLNGRLIGTLDIPNKRRPISVSRLRAAIADRFTLELLKSDQDEKGDIVYANAIDALTRSYLSSLTEKEANPPYWFVDISEPLRKIINAIDYETTKLRIVWKNHPLGDVTIWNQYLPISAIRLRETIVDNIGVRLLEPGSNLSEVQRWSKAIDAIIRHYTPIESSNGTCNQQLSQHISVSVVVPTYDRPEDLRNCLKSLFNLETLRTVEIVVVDNNPSSGLIPPIIAEFPEVVLVCESRKGLSYARNAGLVASSGDIAICVDDDVVVSPNWLEKLIQHFVRSDVMAVTGNVLPYKMETKAEQYFETYGGLGRGFRHFEVNGDWFESFRYKCVPTWNLGATANCAFRASIFRDSDIGLLPEELGAGSPTGCSEDTYLFYRILKSDYTIVYEPEAYVFHKHRQTMRAFRKQIYNYSKGSVAYQLLTLFWDRDLRSIMRIFLELPYSYLWRIKERVLNRNNYPISMILLEIMGNLAAPYALWKSHRRVKKLGRSEFREPYQKGTTIEQNTLQLKGSSKTKSTFLENSLEI